MTTVEGRKMSFVADGPQSVIAEPGVKLSGGYEVQAVTPTAIRLHESQTGTVVELRIPTIPETP